MDEWITFPFLAPGKSDLTQPSGMTNRQADPKRFGYHAHLSRIFDFP